MKRMTDKTRTTRYQHQTNAQIQAKLFSIERKREKPRGFKNKPPTHIVDEKKNTTVQSFNTKILCI